MSSGHGCRPQRKHFGMYHVPLKFRYHSFSNLGVQEGEHFVSPPLPGSGTPKSPDEIGETFNGFSKFSALKKKFSWRKKE